MIDTASFRIPSPNIKLKSLGYSSYLTIVRAATVSEEHTNEDISKIYLIDNYVEDHFHGPCGSSSETGP